MSDEERENVIADLKKRRAEFLLIEVLQWYYADLGQGNLTGLIKKIEHHFLEKENEETSQT